MRLLDTISQFHAVYERHGQEPPTTWAAMTPFPYLAVFDNEEVEEFSRELLPYLEESVRRRDLSCILGNLRAWESSAETYGDEARFKQMEQPLDPEQLTSLPSPILQG